MAVAAALVLQPIQANATQADGKSELANMNALYEYAWSLDYPQQATYDNILEKTESGAAQAVNMLPSAALGYQIKDYDGDDQMELLVVRSDTTQESNQGQLIFQIYEANEGNVVLASEITADMPSFVTGVGKIRVYSRNMGDKIVIGCDQYEEGFLWDGLTLKTSYYDYNGNVLNYNSGTNVMGSIIESDYMKQQFGMIGLNENQIAQIGGDKTVYDCVAGTELITETKVNSDSNIYISWVSSALQGDMQAVGTATITCYSWFPGTKPTIAQKLGTISISPNSQTGQDSIQDPVQQLSAQADYLYIIGDFEIMQIYSMYYLIPDEGVTKYDCYQTDGNYISSIPYGNAKTIPFEKQYFSGGANSVRGWAVRDLGPGSFAGNGNLLDQSGDIKLDASIEYRSKLFWKFQGAAFIDAGNIWTIRSYANQPGGVFKFDKFYKQIAVAYGLGLRLDLDFFILRFDGGMKAVNPAYETKKEHFPIIHPKFSRDFAFHFAVGYPF